MRTLTLLAPALIALAALTGCDDGDGDTPPVVDMAAPDMMVVDMMVEPDMAVVDMMIEPDMAIVDMMPEVDMMPGRLPTGIEAPIAQACPANHRAPQIEFAIPDSIAATFDGTTTVTPTGPGEFTIDIEAAPLQVRVPPAVDAVLRLEGSYETLWRTQTRGYVEHLLVLRNAAGQIVFTAGSGTSWMLQQFQAREAVREDVTLAGRCNQAGDTCYDRIDREMIFAGGNRRRAMLPGTSTDFTTDGGSFQLHVDQAFQVACAVLCPNVANQWFSIWMVRDVDDLMADFDGDGVLDGEDLCVEVAEDMPIDTDEDGIGDACDQAPTEAGPGIPCTHPLDCPSRDCLPSQICRAGQFAPPGAIEVCDGIDNDGNGEVDDGLEGCEEASQCRATATIEAEGELVRGASGAITATVAFEGACEGVTATTVQWDIDEDGEIDSEGDRVEVRRLRGMNAIPVVLRVTDSRGGVTDIQARVPVAASEFCP